MADTGGVSDEMGDRESRRHERELERLLAEFDRRDRQGTWEIYSAPKRRPNPRRTTVLISATVTAMLLSIVVALHPSSEAAAVRRLLGFGPERILAAPELPASNGEFAFIATQKDGKTPVGYDPCTTIEVAINPAHAPDDHRDLVEVAIEHTSAATGLDFTLINNTDATPWSRPTTSARAPVLVAFADEDEVPALEGPIAGVGGSMVVESPNGRRSFVTGSVVLDTDVFNDPDASHTTLQAVVDHEFGHLVGLDHVDDPTELMYPDSVGVTEFSTGDLRGLAQIGRLPCS